MSKTELAQEEIFSLLSQIPDPEIPVITINELGILRKVEVQQNEVVVSITPTYSGCPAMKMIEEQIEQTLRKNGIEKIKVVTVYSPAWTTVWMTEEAREKLRRFGIAPPAPREQAEQGAGITCPHCGSEDIKLVSPFGSTACKALYKCNECKEPFDYFKCH